MRRISTRILIAILTFVMGLLIFVLSDRAVSRFRNCVVELSPEDYRPLVESEIAKTVIRHKIQLVSDVQAPVYFLSQAEDRDASEEVVGDLRREGLPVRKLSQLGMNQRHPFDCSYCPNGDSEYILRLGRIRWLNDKEVLVGASCRRWRLNADRAYLYRVILEGNHWVVKDYELL